MMSIHEAAAYLGISAFSLRKMAREGKVPAGRVGRLWRFHKEDLDEFIRSQYKREIASAIA